MFYRFARAVCYGYFKLLYRLTVIGLEHIPTTGGVLLCSNHISTLDPPIIGVPIKREVHFMAKAELFNIPVLGWLIKKLNAFPVKRGGVSKETIKLSIKLLREGKVMGIFPEGTRGNNTGMGKKGAAMFAVKSGAAVIPVAIIGNYKPFRKMTVIYGPAVDMTPFESGTNEDLEKATEKIMMEIRNLIQTHSASA
ncbi:lysophospholipid acyltransferase family protein [Paenibacillus larvae]|nr:lysophospholipid acyltransferase family protein [Paenibacillus larvae]AQR79416.1 1-acyl-sn-glycerol-3-phosphate acyltransferase [Paenibacillus larvae subsp. larvae]AQT86236.1 1-acyl-sn-glycerol-3-phosphate acyltransferase [Paenibacillus larvae subsp. pulvifaciens]AQZ47864.1 1-acyl-sn-glycerol-3-phosphate acyltransferase [Paenibacillus larvae subsp. pulvifaciens]ARF69622.1 1-acyl-sn-glycerol-3-phosphate acyltransferase [Paenibacillus larvae subsp. pulvifaciens]AVF23404.1 1-acyl-sn-glycerol-3